MSDEQNPPSEGEVYEDNSDGLATVVHIDRREDIAGVCGRIDTAPTFAVVIHAPRGNRQLTTELGMRRLQRHVEETGKAVAIATSSVSLSSRARQVGIPVARKPQHVRWDSGGRTVLRLPGHSLVIPNVGRYFQALTIIAIAILAVGLAFTLGPSATVVAYPPSETVTRTVTITASPAFEDIDVDEMRVPSGRVTAQRTITLALKTTGTVQVGTQPARAVVAITNPTDQEVVLPGGTIFLATPNFEPFELVVRVVLPPGQTVIQGVTASRPGTAGNVAAGAITGWFEEDKRRLQVTNAAPAAGGLSETRPAVSAEDIAAITRMAEDLAVSEALRRTIITARPSDAVFFRTAETRIDRAEIVTPAGTPGDLLTVDVRVTVTAEAILAETLDQFARLVLAVDYGDGEFIPGSVSAVETGSRQVDAEDGLITTELEVTGQFARDISSAKLKDAVKGKSPERARSLLAERYDIDDAEVSISPGWAPWLPRFGSRITIELRSRPADPAPQEGAPNAAASGASPASGSAFARP
jgi:hypothetical protein